MYSTSQKIGNSITVCGCRPSVGTSTTAAIIASLLATRGEKTLLLTTDADAPFDAVSMLSSDIEKTHLDELVILENSNGLTPEALNDYTTNVTENLAYLRASTRLTRLAKDAAKTINHIIDVAQHNYRYVVLDVGYTYTNYTPNILQQTDLIVHVLGQDPKSIAQVSDSYTRMNFGEGKFVVPVFADFDDYIPVSLNNICKSLNVNEVFPIHRDDDIYRAVQNRNIAGFVYRQTQRKTGIFGFKKKKQKEEDRVSAVDELSNICDLITTALNNGEDDAS